jgi:hypothetical protein
MKIMIKKLAITLLAAGSLAACAAQGGGTQNVVATFYDMSDSFSVQGIAPPDLIRELVVCKAVWFAEKKNVRTISLSNPVYGAPKDMRPIPVKVPDNWVILNATAYLTEASPDGNPMFSVAEKAVPCRRTWDWYR